MPGQKITLMLPIDLLARIEEAAKANYCTRSDYLRTAVVLRLNQQPTTPVPLPAPAPQSEDEFLEQLTQRYTKQ